jgi:hypothetical protein
MHKVFWWLNLFGNDLLKETGEGEEGIDFKEVV